MSRKIVINNSNDLIEVSRRKLKFSQRFSQGRYRQHILSEHTKYNQAKQGKENDTYSFTLTLHICYQRCLLMYRAGGTNLILRR